VPAGTSHPSRPSGPRAGWPCFPSSVIDPAPRAGRVGGDASGSQVRVLLLRQANFSIPLEHSPACTGPSSSRRPRSTTGRPARPTMSPPDPSRPPLPPPRLWRRSSDNLRPHNNNPLLLTPLALLVAPSFPLPLLFFTTLTLSSSFWFLFLFPLSFYRSSSTSSLPQFPSQLPCPPSPFAVWSVFHRVIFDPGARRRSKART